MAAEGLGSRLKALARRRSKNLHRVRSLCARWRALPRYDSPQALELLVEWTRERLLFSGARAAVFGASGGVDSSLVACVLARAYPGRCRAYLLPSDSNPQDERDARRLLSLLKIEHQRVDFSPALDALVPLLTPGFGPTSLGNLKTRLRTLILFHEAAAHRGLFVGTGDLDEGFVGYYTKGSGSDLSPIGSLHKREVRALLHLALAPLDPAFARRLSRKPADAGLVKGRTAEKELGVTYRTIEKSIDLITQTCNLYEGGVVPREADAFAAGFRSSRVRKRDFLKVVDLIWRARHKAEGSPVLWREDPAWSGLAEFTSE
ncbi:MAG: NAD(+) synthase [Myxococcaceae bacterium]